MSVSGVPILTSSIIPPTEANPGNRIALLGTSLVQQSVTITTGAKITYTSRGWWAWALFYGKNLFYSPVWLDDTDYNGWGTRGFQGLNGGVSGQTSAEIWDRRAFFVNNIDCDIVVVDCGTNDIGAFDADYIQTIRELLCDYYLANGKTVILLPILSRDTATWASGENERKKANHVNSRTRQYVNTRRNCFLFDWNDAWVDFADSAGQPLTGYSTDGTHFNIAGAEAVGKAFALFMQNFLLPGQHRVFSPDDLFDATFNPYGNFMEDAFILGTSGTVGTGATSSALATGMRLERASGASTVVGTKSVRTDDRGNWQVLTFTCSGSGEDVFYYRVNPFALTIPEATENDWYQGSMEIETNDFAGFTSIQLRLSDDGPNMYSYGMEDYNDGDGNVVWVGQERSGIIETPPVRLPVDTTGVIFRLEIRIDASVSGTPVVRVGGLEMRLVPNPLKTLNYVAPV